MRSYRNFKLKLADYSRSEDGRETLTVFVDESPVGAQDWSERVEVEFPSQLAERHESLRLRELSDDDLITFGKDLAKLLFPPAIREIYYRSLARLQAGEGLRIQIYTGKPEEGHPDLRELELPWEYAYIWAPGTPNDKGHIGFLALDRRISIVRIHKVPYQNPPPPESETVRVVALLSDGSESGHGKLDMVQEEEILRRALARVDGVDLELVRNGKLEDLISSLTEKEAQVFHYAGHGTIKKEPLDEPFKFKKVVYLVLAGEDGGVQFWDGEKVAMELGNRDVRLVVLSACDSGLSGLVPALVNQSIPAVIGMQFTIRDANAVAFSRRFYQALANGKSIEGAVSEGRHGIYQRPVDAGRDWGVPVLHLQTHNSELFPKAGKKYKALGLMTALVLAVWFFMHIYPWLFHNISRFWEELGMGGAALAGLILALKKLGLETWATWPQRKIESWKEQFLLYQHALPIMWVIFIASIVLFAVTSSIYLRVDYPRDVKVNIKSKDEHPWKGKKTLELSQQEGRLLAGGPIFSTSWPVRLKLDLEQLADWKLSDDSIDLYPGVTKRITLSRWKMIRLVPGKNLSTQFNSANSQEVWLEVQVGKSKYKLVRWEGGMLYLGAPKENLENAVRFDDDLKNCYQGNGITEKDKTDYVNSIKDKKKAFLSFSDKESEEPNEPSVLGTTISIKVLIQGTDKFTSAGDPANSTMSICTEEKLGTPQCLYEIPLTEKDSKPEVRESEDLESEDNESEDSESEDIVIAVFEYSKLILEESDFPRNEVFTKCLDL